MKKSLFLFLTSLFFAYFTYAQSGTIVPQQADFLNNIDSSFTNSYAIKGVIVRTNPGFNATAIRAQNNGTGNSGNGVFGSHAGAGNGVYGTTVRGLGVYGYSSGGGIGVSALSEASYGLYSQSTNNVAGRFINTTPSNTNNTLDVVTNGRGNGIFVQLTNASNGSRGIDVVHNGTGQGIFSISTGGNGIEGRTESISYAGVIGRNNTGEAVVGISAGGNGIGAVVGRSDGIGYGVKGFNTSTGIGVLGQAGISGGTGRAGRFENVNTANSSNALEVATNGTGAGAYILHSNVSGTGAGLIVQKNTAYGGLYTSNSNCDFEVRHPFVITTGMSGLRIFNTAGNSNAWTFYTNNGSGSLALIANGNTKGNFDPGTGAYTQVSDVRLKNNIQNYAGTLANLMKIGVKSYQLTHSTKTEIGLIAQEVLAYFPEIVYNHKNDNGEAFYTMDYSRIGVLAIKAIQEQQLIIQKQQNEIDLLKTEMAELKSLVNSLRK
ncbi:tail fiber domain-containing protein [Emticicia sp. BO119]|uniref:tail fiber domain-containing protein n=1 Tax=Emticicia sp. BO119 TaxID=2757768 RepID=UPI0015F0D48E|nr:tail fiber domain-containing protein [Emticicia sp. BO119]MBA4851402.1 tail fiber domain-containing protein [Emticicia sp. BO119]